MKFDSDTVKLITMHSIKGLEFPVVCIIGLNEGVMPYLPNNDKQAKFDEEINGRKLLYVGMTRATEVLYLTSSSRPSVFISDIAPRYLRTDHYSRVSRFYNIPIDKYLFKKELNNMARKKKSGSG